MRISTNSMFEVAVSRINDQQAGLSKIQQQLSSGQRILTPADDPIGATKVLNLSQGQAMNAQFTDNRTSAKASLNQQEGVLQGVTSLLQDVRTQVLAAGAGTLDATSRKFIATELRSRLQELTGLANSRDGVGNYMFAGFKDTAQPFSGTGAATAYNGDNGQKLLQVGAGRQLPVNDSGESVFMKVAASGVFNTSASGTGTATISSVGVTDKNATLPGHEYAVRFGNGGTSYQVFDTTMDPGMAGTPAAAGAYESPQSIAVDGLEFQVSGTPADGDSVTAEPVRSQSVFKTMDDLITALEKPAISEGARKDLTNSLAVGGSNIDNALNNVLSVRASVGARLQEMDSLDMAGSARDIQYAEQISGIQDVDYVKAISDMTQKQMTLQAAQQSFVKVSGLSLFNFL